MMSGSEFHRAIAEAIAKPSVLYLGHAAASRHAEYCFNMYELLPVLLSASQDMTTIWRSGTFSDTNVTGSSPSRTVQSTADTSSR